MRKEEELKKGKVACHYPLRAGHFVAYSKYHVMLANGHVTSITGKELNNDTWYELCRFFLWPKPLKKKFIDSAQGDNDKAVIALGVAYGNAQGDTVIDPGDLNKRFLVVVSDHGYNHRYYWGRGNECQVPPHETEDFLWPDEAEEVLKEAEEEYPPYWDIDDGCMRVSCWIEEQDMGQIVEEFLDM